MRKRLFEIIEKAEKHDVLSKVYDILMLLVIFVSLLPLTMKAPSPVWVTIDWVCAYIFMGDYILRWITADFRSGNKRALAYYPLTPLAILDLIAILPYFSVLNRAFRAVRVVRVFKAFRIFKTFRYSKNFIMIGRVIKKNAAVLTALLICAVFYIFVSALFIFSIEPGSFDNFFEALYWATTALTTVGYGDIYPMSDGGRLISMLSSFFGIAMVALPAGVITAGFIRELEQNGENNKREAVE